MYLRTHSDRELSVSRRRSKIALIVAGVFLVAILIVGFLFDVAPILVHFNLWHPHFSKEFLQGFLLWGLILSLGLAMLNWSTVVEDSEVRSAVQKGDKMITNPQSGGCAMWGGLFVIGGAVLIIRYLYLIIRCFF